MNKKIDNSKIEWIENLINELKSKWLTLFKYNCKHENMNPLIWAIWVEINEEFNAEKNN